MNGLRAALSEIRLLGAGFNEDLHAKTDALIIPPATLLVHAADILSGSLVQVGAQDCAIEGRGAYTGDISTEMLADAGARFVIVGHSERRLGHGETDTRVRAKAEAAWRAGLTALICVGETQAECDAGRTSDVLSRQIANSVPPGAVFRNTVIAYEPVWAIGSASRSLPI